MTGPAPERSPAHRSAGVSMPARIHIILLQVWQLPMPVCRRTTVACGRNTQKHRDELEAFLAGAVTAPDLVCSCACAALCAAGRERLLYVSQSSAVCTTCMQRHSEGTAKDFN